MIYSYRLMILADYLTHNQNHENPLLSASKSAFSIANSATFCKANC